MVQPYLIIFILFYNYFCYSLNYFSNNVDWTDLVLDITRYFFPIENFKLNFILSPTLCDDHVTNSMKVKHLNIFLN